MIPAILLRVYAGLGLCRGASRAGAAAAGHAIAVLVQIVERLLDEAVLEEEARRVTVRATMVRIPGLVQRVAKHLAALRHPPTDQNPRQLAELDVGQAVLAELEAAAIADCDAARWAGIPIAANALQHRRQLEVLRLAQQALPFAEALRQIQGLVAQKVQYVAEEDAVAVQKITALAVLGQGVAPLGPLEQLAQQRALLLQQGIQRRRIVHAAHI